MMKVYADPITINCRKVPAGLALLDAPCERVHVGYFEGEQKDAALTALNPNASLPALVDGDLVLRESNAILQGAADKLGRDTAYPRDLATRADINRWLLWESSSWFPRCYVYLVEDCVKPLRGGGPDAAVLEAHAAQFHKLAGILDARLAGRKWIATNNPTIADIALAAPTHLHGWACLPIADHPNLKRWLTESVETLPCWQTTWVGEGFITERVALAA